MSLDPTQALGGFLEDPSTLGQISQLLVAQFDESGFGFPIRALLVGPRALAELSFRGRRARERNNQVRRLSGITFSLQDTSSIYKAKRSF